VLGPEVRLEEELPFLERRMWSAMLDCWREGLLSPGIALPSEAGPPVGLRRPTSGCATLPANLLNEGLAVSRVKQYSFFVRDGWET